MQLYTTFYMFIYFLLSLLRSTFTVEAIFCLRFYFVVFCRFEENNVNREVLRNVCANLWFSIQF